MRHKVYKRHKINVRHMRHKANKRHKINVRHMRHKAAQKWMRYRRWAIMQLVFQRRGAAHSVAIISFSIFSFSASVKSFIAGK